MSEGDRAFPPYAIYGLTVASDIALPELSVVAATVPPDVVIRTGDVPAVWAETDRLNVRSILDGAPGHLWVRIEGTVRMNIRDGRMLEYAIEPGGKEDAVRLFLLGSGMGAILMQRDFVVVHGNAITLPGRTDAMVCIGDSGAGKSTTAIAMMQRGFSILADDICPIGPDWRIEPGMPRAKLWEETARHLGLDTTGLARVRDSDAKFNLPLGERHCTEARNIHSFIWLVPGDVDAIAVSEITGIEKFAVLRNNIYRPEFLLPLELEASYLKQVARLASETRLFKVTRPRAGFEIDPLLDTIALLYESADRAIPARP